MRPLDRTFRLVFALWLMTQSDSVRACERTPPLPFPPTCPNDRIRFQTGFQPSQEPCVAGDITAVLSICSDAGDTFDWTVIKPVMFSGTTFAGCTADLPPCTTILPPTDVSGTVVVAPMSCESVAVVYQIAGCADRLGLIIDATVVPRKGGGCSFRSCGLRASCPAHPLLPPLVASGDRNLVAAPAGSEVGWNACLRYDGPARTTSGEQCVTLRQLSLFATELFAFEVLDANDRVIASAPMIDVVPGVPRDVLLGKMELSSGASDGFRFRCPFEGACFAGVANDFQIFAQPPDALGDCGPPTTPPLYQTAVLVTERPALLLHAATDLGGGAMRLAFAMRGPMTNLAFVEDLRGDLEVDGAIAYLRPNPHASPAPPLALTAAQPVVTTPGPEGGSRVTLDLAAIGARDPLAPSYFQDIVIVEIDLHNPRHKPTKGPVDLGAMLTFTDPAMMGHTVSLPAVSFERKARAPKVPGPGKPGSSGAIGCDRAIVGGN